MNKNGIATQKELAKHLGISKNQLSMLLSDHFNPIKSNALKLCEVLDTNLEEIIEYVQNEIPVDDTYITENEQDGDINAEAFQGQDFIEVRGLKAVKDYTCVELFAGAGGLALGLEEAGFHSLGLVEIDKLACQTLRKNRPNWNVIEKDIIQIVDDGVTNYVNISKGELDLDETRPFTIREYARIQSFPDTWQFDCNASNAYKQIGNAVPVNMAKAIGLSIVNILNQIN